MASNASRLIARLLWIFPALLAFLAVNQAWVAYELHQTLEEGQPAVAEVYAYFASDRVDVVYDYVSLRVPLGDGRVIEHEKMSLPHSLAPRLKGKETVDVRVRPGAEQEIVITSIAQAQWRIAAINAAISLLGFLLLAAGVFAWNRYLRRRGDPADRLVSESS